MKLFNFKRRTKNAKQMFEALGYKLRLDDSITIYEKKNEFSPGDVIICLDSSGPSIQLKHDEVCIPLIFNWKEIEACKVWKEEKYGDLL